MSAPAVRGRLQWSVVVPVLALLVLAAAWSRHEHWARSSS
jgi:Ca2+:H+ antiporter